MLNTQLARKRSTFSFHIIYFLLLILPACSISKQIDRSAKADVINTKTLQAAHVGISIFDPSTNNYLYNYQGDKYFVPASNTKIPTCYAAMKYLGDSLIAARMITTDTSLLVIPSGDPTFLHPDYKTQRLIERLRSEKRSIYITGENWKDEPLGSGWSWNDYDQYYMAERSPMPVYGNILEWVQEITDSTKPPLIYSNPEINWEVSFSENNSNRFFFCETGYWKKFLHIGTGKGKKENNDLHSFCYQWYTCCS